MLAIAANKQDLRKDQAVSDTQLATYAASIGALHGGTSAKSGEGLEEIFQALADRVAAQHRDQMPAPGDGSVHFSCKLSVLQKNAQHGILVLSGSL